MRPNPKEPVCLFNGNITLEPLIEIFWFMPSNLTEPDFSKKVLFWFLDKKCPNLIESQFFQVSWKIDALNVFWFLLQVTATYSKLLNDFLGMIFWGFWTKMGPKYFFKFYEKLTLGTFLGLVREVMIAYRL